MTSEASNLQTNPPFRAITYSSFVDHNYHGSHTVYSPAFTFEPIATGQAKKDVHLITSHLQHTQLDDEAAPITPANEPGNKADTSAFFNYMHLPSFSSNNRIDRNYNDGRAQLVGRTSMTLPAFVYQSSSSLNGKVYTLGGLRSIYDNEPMMDLLPGENVADLQIELDYDLPTSLNKNILTSPYLAPDRPLYIINSSTSSFTVHQMKGDVPPSLIQATSTVISKRHIFLYGGFEIITDGRDKVDGKIIVKKSIRMNQYGYILDTVTLSSHRVKFQCASEDIVMGRVGHSLSSTIYDDAERNDESPTSPTAGPHIHTPGALSLAPSLEDDELAFRTRSNQSNQLFLAPTRSNKKIPTTSIKRPISPPIPTSLYIGSPLTRAESNTSDMTHSSTISLTGTTSSSSSSIKNLIGNTTAANILIFIFGGMVLEGKQFVATNDFLKIELVINTKGKKNFYKFNDQLLVNKLITDDENAIWPSERAYMGNCIINHQVLKNDYKPFVIQPHTHQHKDSKSDERAHMSTHSYYQQPRKFRRKKIAEDRFNSQSYRDFLFSAANNPGDFLEGKALVIQGGSDGENLFSDLYWFEFELGEWFKVDTFGHISERNGIYEEEIQQAGLFKESHCMWQSDNYLLIWGGIGTKEANLKRYQDEDAEPLPDINYMANPDVSPKAYHRISVLNLETQTWFYPKYTHNFRNYVSQTFRDQAETPKGLASILKVNYSVINSAAVFENAKILSIGGEYRPYYIDDADYQAEDCAISNGKLHGRDLLLGGALSLEVPLISIRKLF